MNLSGKPPIYKKIFERAKPYLGVRNNLVHTQIALRYALKLLEQEKGDESVILPAVILHDVGWKTIPEDLILKTFGPHPSHPELARVHELEGAKIARRILEELRYPSGMVREICRIIRGHDSRNKPISQNDRIVKDADKLFRYSRRGFAIELGWFPVPPERFLKAFEKKIEEWFLLPSSRELARREFAQRRKEWLGRCGKTRYSPGKRRKGRGVKTKISVFNVRR